MEQQEHATQNDDMQDGMQAQEASPAPRTPVTMALIVANVAMYALTTLFGFQSFMIYNRLSLVPANLGIGNLWTLVTSMFLHADLGHILANMYSLYALGQACEPVLGRRDYLVTYFGGGIAGSLMFVLLRYGQATAVVGASGAICSLLGFYGAFLMRARRKAKDDEDPRRQALESAWMNFLVILLINVAIVPVQGNIAWEGHLGGFIFGALFGSWFLRRRDHAQSR